MGYCCYKNHGAIDLKTVPIGYGIRCDWESDLADVGEVPVTQIQHSCRHFDKNRASR